MPVPPDDAACLHSHGLFVFGGGRAKEIGG